MKLTIYKFKAAHSQYQPEAEIVVAHSCLSKAYELAEEATNCALSIVKTLGEQEMDVPQIISNSFKKL